MRLSTVAGRLGITVPAIYRHFISKDDLLRALGREALEELCLNFEGAANAKHDFSPVGEAYLAYALSRPPHYRLALLDAGEAAQPAGGATTVIRRLEPLVAEYLMQRMPGSASSDQGTINQLAVDLFAAAHGLASMVSRWRLPAHNDVAAIVGRTLCPITR